MNPAIRMMYRVKGMEHGEKHPQFIMSNVGHKEDIWHMSNGANFTTEEINEYYVCLNTSRLGPI